MSGGNDYFNQALSDFMFEVASGGSIRHLVDLGYSVDQIMAKLAFPTPRERVEKTVCQYMKEKGILLTELPAETQNMRAVLLEADHLDQVSSRFLKSLDQNGEERAYLECPFGYLQKNDLKALEERIGCLNNREQEYLRGIRWERNVMYHRLNSRMREIAGKLVICGGQEIKCFFLETEEVLTVRRKFSPGDLCISPQKQG